MSAMETNDFAYVENLDYITDAIGKIVNYYRPDGDPIPEDILEECHEIRHMLGYGAELIEFINHTIYLHLITNGDCKVAHEYAEYRVIVKSD